MCASLNDTDAPSGNRTRRAFTDYNENNSHLRATVKLTDLPQNRPAVVVSLAEQSAGDAIARRMREIGFVPGEQVVVTAAAPMSRDPLMVRIGTSAFALRRSEAARVEVELAP